MPIQLKRVYVSPAKQDGYRILVERLWPRGLTKAEAKVDLWLKEVAPSTELRQWFQHDPGKWREFKKRYFTELRSKIDLLEGIKQRVKKGPVTFVFASKEERLNNAAALKEYLEKNLKP